MAVVHFDDAPILRVMIDGKTLDGVRKISIIEGWNAPAEVHLVLIGDFKIDGSTLHIRGALLDPVAAKPVP